MVSALADQHGLKSLAIPEALRASGQFAPASLGARTEFLLDDLFLKISQKHVLVVL